MRDNWRRKQNFQSSTLDPSWILPLDDGQDGLSISVSNASEDVSVSGKSAGQPDPDDTTSPEQANGQSTDPVPGNNSLLASQVSGTQSSVRLTRSSAGEEVPGKPQDESQLSALDSSARSTPAKGRKKTRYAKQHPSEWLDHGMGLSAEYGEASSSPRVQRPMQPQSESTANALKAVPSTSDSPSLFRVKKSSDESPGYDAPPILPNVSSAYSPAYTS